MLQRSKGRESASPARLVRVVIEDRALAEAAASADVPGLDVRICSGPIGDHETCPLVLDGSCPLGPCDVVVCGLDGPWAPAVRNAWADAGVVVTPPSTTDSSPSLNGSVGSALQTLWREQFGARSQ